ncbi:MAG: hypothetical protein PVI01_18735 [Gemmatimonadales bacterium]|jgi:cell division septal protein FtsQ
MTYVPTPVTVIPQASIQARELAQRIERTIVEYRQDHPHLSDLEISQALRIASNRTGAGQRSRMVVALALGLTALLALGVLLFGLLAT